MIQFAIQITDKDWGGKQIILENVSESSIQKTLSITTHPVVSGDEIADHFYKNPATMSFSGTISLNGSKPVILNSLPQDTPLRSYQKFFEKLQDEGHLCDIVKIQRGEDGNTRFLKRENMVLSSISWTENINTLDFSFSWTQALTVEASEYVPDETDTDLPKVDEAPTVSFSERAIDWTYVEANIFADLIYQSLLQKELLQYIVEKRGNIPIIKSEDNKERLFNVSGIAIKIPTDTNVWYGILQGIGFVTLPIGWFFPQFSLYGNYPFTYSGIESIDDKTCKRLSDFLSLLHENFLNYDKLMTVYQIATNSEQDVIVGIQNKFYLFQIRWDNINQTYKLDIVDYSLTEKENTAPSLGGLSDMRSAITDYSQATNNNAILKAPTGEYVHCIRYPTKNDTYNLKNYSFVVSPPDKTPDEFWNKIWEIATISFRGRPD